MQSRIEFPPGIFSTAGTIVITGDCLVCGAVGEKVVRLTLEATDDDIADSSHGNTDR